MLKRNKYIQGSRLIIQLSFLAIVTYDAIMHQIKGGGPKGFPNIHSICPFGALETMYKFVAGGEFLSKIHMSNIVLLIGIVLLAFFVGRYFCGWICALGTQQELFGKLGKKLFKKRFEIPRKIDLPLRSLKYIILVLILYLTWKTATLIINPYDPFSAYAHIFGGFSEMIKEYLIGFSILIVSLIASMFFDRFFCKYLCPLGVLRRENEPRTKIDTPRNYFIEFIVPSTWTLLAPYETEKIEHEKEKTTLYKIECNEDSYPVFLTGKRIIPLFEGTANENSYTVYGRKYLKYLFKEKDKATNIIGKINDLKEYVENFLGRKIDQTEYRMLLVGLTNISLNVGESSIISVLHLNSLLKEKEPVEIYDIIYDLALKITNKMIEGERIQNDHWLAEGLAHLTAIEYFKNNYDLNLNLINGNPFLNFLFGKKRSRFGLSKGIFSDLTRYGAIKTIAKDNSNKLVDYDYRAYAINNHYSIQVFYNIRNLIGEDKFNDLFRIIIEKSKNELITTNIFFEELKKMIGEEGHEIIRSFTDSYPEIDYSLKRKKGKIYVLRKMSSANLPLEIEVVDKQGNRKRFVQIIEKEKTELDIDLKKVRNIILDPDRLIDERNEANNFLIKPVHFSILSPMSKMDTYNIAASGVLCDYNNVMMGGASVTGGWNMGSFTPNSLNKPLLLWGLDVGYGYDSDKNFRNINNVFINVFFETSTYPKSIWSPHFYTYYFWITGESMNAKTGFQGFLPPVINTEHDNFFFNHSWDAGFDAKFAWYPLGTIDFNINTGYRIYLKWGYFRAESILAVNFDFDRIAPRDINIGYHFNGKLDFHIFEIGVRPGVFKSFFPYQRYEFTRPKFTRFSLATQSIGYYETITKDLTYAKNLIYDFPYPRMDFFFISSYLMFKFNLYKEPLLDPLVTLGIGAFADFTIPIPIVPERVKALFVGAKIQLDIMKKVSIIIKGTFLPIYNINNQMFRVKNPLGLIFYEIRAFL